MAFEGRGSVSAANFITHQEGHSAALDAALADLASKVADKPVTFTDCQIVYQAVVTVTNPAVVDEYIAIVRTP